MSQLDLANLALAELGEPPVAEVDSASTTSPVARVLGRTWDFALKQFLREFPWGWAKTRAALTVASATPLFEWDRQVELPDDFITILSINEMTVSRPGDWWEIEGGMLLTDNVGSDDTVFIEYIYFPSATDTDTFVARMDPLAAQALAVLWAARIAPTIVRDGGNRSAMLMQQYQTMYLPRARIRAIGERKNPYPGARTESLADDSRYWGTAG